MESPSDLHDPSFTIQYTPRWFTEILQNGVHALSEAAKYSIPTLFLYGQQDPLIDQSLIQKFFDCITSKDKEYVMFPDGRHRPLHEHHKDQAVNSIFQWVSTRL